MCVQSDTLKIDNHEVQKQSFLKSAMNFLRPALFVSINEWIICVQIFKPINPNGCA